MRCPHCDIDDDRVIDSRSIDGGASIRRRRQCNACGRRYTTYERVEKTGRLMVVKKDGTRVPFDPQKVLQGVQAAC
ncbi:MAG: ATP cone domain-containing protein, partial [Phycisphaerales bacterium]